MNGFADFLQAGGQMGKLTRDYNWSHTSIGSIDRWSPSLSTALGIVLRSPSPMCLWWGPDLIQFYNDAYLPFMLTLGKHPAALGVQAEISCGGEWGAILSIVNGILLTGESVLAQDQMLRIHRNGQWEETYWTSGYSPVVDENGHIRGVLTTTTETTQKVKDFRALTVSQNRFHQLIQECPLGIVVLKGGGMVVDIVNPAYGRLVDRTPVEMLGKNLFDLIPEAESRFRPILDKVRETGEPVYLYDYPYVAYQGGKVGEGFLNLRLVVVHFLYLGESFGVYVDARGYALSIPTSPFNGEKYLVAFSVESFYDVHMIVVYLNTC